MIQNNRELGDLPDDIPGATAKDKENRRIPFNPNGRGAAVLERRAALGPDAFVFGSANGVYQPNIQTAWETLRLLANGIETKPEGRERNGIENSSNGSISGDTTCDATARADCSRIASTSASSD